EAEIAAWCRRGLSIGADGLFTLRRHDGGGRMDYWNADGPGAPLCINGTRGWEVVGLGGLGGGCVARRGADRGARRFRRTDLLGFSAATGSADAAARRSARRTLGGLFPSGGGPAFRDLLAARH